LRGVTAVAAGRVVLGVTKMIVHLALRRRLGDQLGQPAQQPTLADERARSEGLSCSSTGSPRLAGPATAPAVVTSITGVSDFLRSYTENLQSQSGSDEQEDEVEKFREFLDQDSPEDVAASG
jgi:hypothetical protein